MLDDVGFTCDGCKERRPLKDFTAVVCKQYLQGERRAAKKCFECHYPRCAIDGCQERPRVAVSHNHVEKDGKWYCHSHRYPPCSVCRKTPRPASAISGKIKFKDWICDGCQASEPPGGLDSSGGLKAEARLQTQAAAAALDTDATPRNEQQKTDGKLIGGKYALDVMKKTHSSHLVRINGKLTTNGKARCRVCSLPDCGACGHKPPGPLAIDVIVEYKATGDGKWYRA